MAIPYDPQTDEGTGFLVSVFKATQHMHSITMATAYEWAITTEQARAELEHINVHVTEAMRVADQGILAEQSLTYLRDWYDQTQGQIKKKLTELEAADPKKGLPKAKEFRLSLRELETQTWALLAHLDHDLIGWGEVPDAGRKP